MVRLGVSGALVLIFAATAASAAPKSFGVRSVRVTADGLWKADPNGQQTQQDCARFKIGDKSALRWFRASREVTKRDWLENAEWTQCSASGTLVTGDGRVYSWDLDQSGRGRVAITPTVEVYLSGSELPFASR